MKIKYYSNKLNGEVKKTPDYFDMLDTRLLRLIIGESGWGESLYALYSKLTKTTEFIDNHMFVGSQPISAENVFLACRTAVIEYEETVIKPLIAELELKQSALRASYQAKCTDIYFMVFDSPRVCGEFEINQLKLNALKAGSITYTQPSEQEDYCDGGDVDIVSDISPISAEHLLAVAKQEI